ncbi:MAG: hypothetical protein RR795_00950 [Cetobacterium sp.]|uniref:FomA family porin-like outer membrane protein n=1 Tax=Cetobacterium sp. TaxID=2071632 RepID=UPI002FCCA160
MKKLALLLGSLLVVGTTAQAKEVIAAPVEVSKEVVVVAEEVVEVITPAFRPSGYVGVQYRAYGETEGHGDKIIDRNANGDAADDNQDTWNRGANNYSRLETTFGVQATENFSFEGRIRDYNNLESNDSDKYDNGEAGTETRLRAYYQHNDWLTSRVQYRDEEDDSQNLEYQIRMLAYKNEGGLLSKLLFAPKVYHSFPEDGGGNYMNTIGMDIEYAGNLPLGFTWDGTIYLNQNFYNHDFYTGANGDQGKDAKDTEFAPEWEIYLYRTFALYSTDRYAIDLNFEGGYDPYKFGQYDKYTEDTKTGQYVKTSNKTTYSLYAQFALEADYKINEYLTANAGVAAEYRNWSNTDQNSASHWRWQPFAFVGMKTTF